MLLATRQQQAIYQFERVALRFVEGRRTNVFSMKNNKSLRETIEQKRYLGLRTETLEKYTNALDQPLGAFLLEKKLKGDLFYKRFLNAYGDAIYSTFCIADDSFLKKRGVYAYVVDGNATYVGRCRDSMSNRINQGYGKIHPKNCYLDGQATNCHLNALITAAGTGTELWHCSIDSIDNIAAIEIELVRTHSPPWNIHRFL